MDNGFVVAFLEFRPASFSVGLADCSIRAEVIVQLTVQFVVKIGSPSVEFKRLRNRAVAIGMRETEEEVLQNTSALCQMHLNAWKWDGLSKAENSTDKKTVFKRRGRRRKFSSPASC